MPFLGTHRLIDFPLSNCLHSGVPHVWVLQQFNPVSLSDHLSNGRPWDLDRTFGGLLVVPPRQGSDRAGWNQGTADALWRSAPMIRELAPRTLVVVSADAVYRLDYRAVTDAHVASGAAATFVTKRLPGQDVSRYGVVQVEDGRVVDYVYKPDEPASDVISNEVFAFDTETVLSRLDAIAEEAGDDGLSDLGDALLPGLVADGQAREHRMDGYWRDVGTVESYWQAHMDFVTAPPFDLDEAGWQIRTREARFGPARVDARAEVEASLLAPGSHVAGTVRRSVVGPGAVVEAGAVVEDSVLLPGAQVRSQARVRRVVADEGAVLTGTCGGERVTLVGAEPR